MGAEDAPAESDSPLASVVVVSRDSHIRPANAGDVQFLWEMLYLASHSYEEDGVTPQDIRSNPDLVRYISGWETSGLPGMVAETPADGPIGAAWLRRLDTAEYSAPIYVDAETPELAIAVRPAYQGLGLGSALLSALTAHSRGTVPAIVLSARADNPAVRLYERHGFRTVGMITNRVGTTSVKMVLHLGDGDDIQRG